MAASTTPSTAIHELQAFCPGCPEPGEVTAFLDSLGFTLGFTMGAVPAHDRTVAPFPAQYHYERDDGLCIIYLAGRDTPMSGEHFPAHQSRFWAYAGAESAAFDRITRALAVRWGFFTWQRATQDGQRPAQRAHVGKPRRCSDARATDVGRHQARGSEPGNLVRRARGHCVDGKIRRRLWLVSAEPGRATSRLDLARADKTGDRAARPTPQSRPTTAQAHVSALALEEITP